MVLLICLVGCELDEGGGVFSGGGQGGAWGGGGGSAWDTGGGTCDSRNEQCGPGRCGGEGANMLPGSDCLACHAGSYRSEDGEEEGDRFGVGGTVYESGWGGSPAPGTVVRVTDSRGQVVEMQANRVGNFYSARSLTPPLRAEVERDGFVIEMSSDAPSGACGSCHRCDDEGKIYAP